MVHSINPVQGLLPYSLSLSWVKLSSSLRLFKIKYERLSNWISKTVYQLWCHLQKALLRFNILHCTKMNKTREKYSNIAYCIILAYLCFVERRFSDGFSNLRCKNVWLGFWVPKFKISLVFLLITSKLYLNSNKTYCYC